MSFFNLPTKLRLARSLLTKEFPVYVQYYITARCNLSCEQCNVIYANADVREADTEEAGRIADNLARIGVSVVLLTGGEPFARQDLPEIIRAFTRNGIHTRIQTNGLASRRALEACVEAGANDISISLDSLDPTTQDVINGDFHDSWHKAIRAISLVNELFPSDALAVFGCVLAPRNLEQIPDVIRFATEIGWWVSLVPAHATPATRPRSFRTFDTSVRMPPSMFGRVDAVLDQVQAMKREGHHVYDSAPFFDDMRRFIRGERVGWRDRNGGVCDSPNLYFAVLPNGEMAACCDWRLRRRVLVSDPTFADEYFSDKLRTEVRDVVSGCEGCLFGSFSEITISSRWLKPMFERTMSFARPDPRRAMRKLSERELIEIAAEIRGRSPELYKTTGSRGSAP